MTTVSHHAIWLAIGWSLSTQSHITNT